VLANGGLCAQSLTTVRRAAEQRLLLANQRF